MGCTSALYERPVSLRSWRSWMPARKSWASRIMGERDVRAMAVSTSISTLASVPSTISTRIGSTVVPSGVRRLPCSYAVGSPAGFTAAPSWAAEASGCCDPVAASTGASRVAAVWQEKHMSGLRGGRRGGCRRGGGPGDDEVAERVDTDGEAGVHRDRRSELLDDRGALDRVAGEQVGSPPDVRVDVAGVGVEADRAHAAVGPLADVGRALRRREVTQLRARDRADTRDAEVDPLDLLRRVAPEVVAVERAVLVVEARGDARGIRLVDVTLGRGDSDLVGLAEVAQVDGARVAVALAREPFGVKGTRGLGGEVVERLLHGGVVERVVPGDGRLDVVVLDVDGEQAEGGDVAGVLRDDDAGEAEDVDEAAGEQRSRATERREHEVAHVETALDRHLAQRVGLVPRGDLEDAGRAALEVEAQAVRECGDAGAGRLDVEGDLAAEQVRGDASERHVGVGDRRLGAALERALGGDPRDGATTRPDGDDVDHRDLARVGADGALGCQGRLAREDDGHVGRGTAAVAREDLVE